MKLALSSLMVAASAIAQTVPLSTTTTLTISATTVPYKTPITLTATVTAGGAPVSTGLVLFCDQSAQYCENNSALATAQLTASTATATVKVGSGPLGVHSYQAVYLANNFYSTSTSNTVSYTVQGTYGSQTAIASSGVVGQYTLAATVTGVGSLTTAPTGTVSFLDESAGNNLLGTEALSGGVLSEAFAEAPDSPFAVGNSSTKVRSVTIESAYLNGDNNLDLVTGDYNQIITVLLGNGDGTFQPKQNYAGCTSGRAVKMLLADFNRDGFTDIALGCSTGSSGGITILLGNGDGSFRAPVSYSSGDVEGMALGDFNGDGLLDVVVTDQTGQNVMVFLGNGDGSFQNGYTAETTPSVANDIVAGDFNQDGKEDIAYAVGTSVSGSNLSDLYVALGNGDGTFQTPTKVASQIGEFLTAGDLNADNKPDIVSTTITGASHIGPYLFVLLGNGDGTFKTPVAYTSDIPSDPHIADVNGDGKPDVIAGGSYGALVYLGNDDGTLQAYSEPVIGGFSLTYAVNAGDFNNDGNADLTGTDANSPRAAVSLSEVQQAADATALTGVAVFPLGSGLHNVAASYPGDSIYAASISSTVALMAAPTPTTLTLSVSPTSAVLSGQSVTLTATLSPYTVGPPTTTTDGEIVNFYSGSTLVGSALLSGGVATLVTTSLPVGTDSLKAIYSGDSNYNSSTSGVVSLTVTGVLLNSSPNPSTYGQSVALTATVPAGATGSVTFMDGTTSLGSGPLSGSTASISVSSLIVGSHSLTAVYAGDGSHSTATSPVVMQVVNIATPTISVADSPSSSTYGDTVMITATVTQGATGMVTFTSGGVALGTGMLKGAGTASIQTSTLPAGTDTITASYSGDNNYSPASATTTQTVARFSPTSVLTSSANPAVPGAMVVFTDTLSSATGSGTVIFTYGSTTLGTVTVSNGVASVSTSTLPLGSDTITATYSGDSNNNGSVTTLTETVAKLNPTVTVTTSGPSVYGNPVTITASVPAGDTGTIAIVSGGVTLGSSAVNAAGNVVVTTSLLPAGNDTITANYSGDTTNNPENGSTIQIVSKAAPTISLSSSANPSTINESITLTATLPIGTTGTVAFSSGSTSLGSPTVSNGIATVTTSSLPLGNDPITANYGGDSNYTNVSASLTQVVNKNLPMVTVTTSGPSVYGTSVTVTASVPSGVTGSISFTSGGLTLGSGTISGGSVVITTTVLPVGSDTITASYGGDSNNSAATGSVVQAVSKASPGSTLTSSLNPATPGASVTFTDTLPSTVTGTVTFTDGSTSLGVIPVVNGVASVTTTSLPSGSNTITAVYGGDGNNTGSTASLIQTVQKNTPTVTVTTSGPSVYGATVTITASVPSGVTGMITFVSGGVTLGSGPVNGGSTVITTNVLPVGPDTITANYGGDPANNSASGSAVQQVSKASPSLALTSSLNPALAEQAITFTATLPTNITGSVSFTSNGTSLGTGTILNGIATVTTSTLPVGSYAVVATYAGDSNNNGATGNLTEIVNKNTPLVTVTTSGPSVYGASVTITASVPSGVTGTISFTSGGVTLGSGAISGGTAVIATTVLPVGTDTITASYGGDSNNNSATGSTQQSVSKDTPTVTVATSGPSTYGNPVTITATLPPGTTGSVTVTSGGITIGSVPIIGGTATITTTTLPVGSDTITVSYGGDTNNNPAQGTATQIVNTQQGSVSLMSSLNPSTVNQAVTFTATVPATETGTITFYDGSTAIGSGVLAGTSVSITTSSLTVGTHTITAGYSGDTNHSLANSSPLAQIVNKATPVLPPPGVSSTTISSGGSETITETVPTGVSGPVTFTSGGTTIGTVPIVGGVATITVTNLPVGSDPITASTPGDANNNPATSPATTVTVGKTTPTIGLSSSLNPSTFAQSVVFTASLSVGATGAVTFMDGATTLGTTVLSNGVASITTGSLTTGTHTITAVYAGDSNYNNATSSPLMQIVNKGAPSLPPPVVSNPTETYGGSETITETVPTGVSGPVTFTSGGVILGTAPIVGGVATITVTNLPVGSDPITASTPGDANNNPATSPATTVTVEKLGPPVTLVSSANPAADGQAVTFTATTTAGATGTITFRDGSTVIGTGQVSTAGIATMTASTLTIGSHTITAAYSGDSNYSPSTSTAVNEVINKIATSVVLTQSVSTELLNSSVTFTAMVAAPMPTPTGTVTFMDGTTVLGSSGLSTNGSVTASFDLSGNAAWTTSSLTTGSHTITAVYSGDNTFLTSVSAPVTNIVQDFTNKNSGASSQNLFPGDSTSYTFTLTPIGSTTFMSDLNLTVTGLPAGTTYTFSPATISAGSGNTTVTLNITTSSSLQANNRRRQDIPLRERDVPVALGMFGLAGLGVCRRYRKRMPRMLLALLLLAGSLLPVLGLSGCAGGYFALNPTSYSVSVTGTEVTIQHAATATLIVQ